MAPAKITISNRQKEIEIPKGMKTLMRKCVNEVIRTEGIEDVCEVSITFVSGEEIRKINAEYRDVDRETDVLSFPLGEDGEYEVNYDTGALMLGDMVINLQRAKAQAEEYGHALEREVGYLTVHSVLHLLGYDHVNGGDEQKLMREREEEVLGNLGLTRESGYVE